jgi:hypothetical protein
LISAEELKKAQAEVSEEDLEGVAGGVWFDPDKTKAWAFG